MALAPGEKAQGLLRGYPDGYNGQTDIGAYYEPVWTWDSMSDAIGHPDDVTGIVITNRLWRRRRPRRIHFLNQTKSSDEVFGLTLGNCEVGDKAEYFASGVTYRGVYEYQGGGVWVPVPSGSTADTMDSNEPYQSRLWIYPAGFQVGDIVDWHLFENVVEVCKRLEWTDLIVETYADGFHPFTRKKQGNVSDDVDGPTPGATNADAIAAMNSATVAYSGRPSRWTQWFYAETSEPPYNTYEAVTTDCKIGATFYKGLGREIVYYGQPDEQSWDIDSLVRVGLFHPQGSSVVYGQFSILKSKSEAAGADEFSLDYEDMWEGFPEPTYWEATTPGERRGFELRFLHAIAKWDFVWT